MSIEQNLLISTVHCRIGSLEGTTFTICINAHVHSRIGSLEVKWVQNDLTLSVHCRIGSLEVCGSIRFHAELVHCRIGSLEVIKRKQCLQQHVHCRIGSLEVLFSVILMEARYSVSNSCNKKPIISEDNWLEQRVWLSDYSSIIPITRYYNQIVFM